MEKMFGIFHRNKKKSGKVKDWSRSLRKRAFDLFDD